MAVLDNHTNSKRKVIFDQVIKLVSAEAGVHESELTEEISFVNDLDMNQDDCRRLVLLIEEAFSAEHGQNLRIPHEVGENFTTVRQVVDYLLSIKAEVNIGWDPYNS